MYHCTLNQCSIKWNNNNCSINKISFHYNNYNFFLNVQKCADTHTQLQEVTLCPRSG